MDHTFCVYFNVIAKIYVYRLCDKPLTSNKTNKFKIEYDDKYVIQNKESSIVQIQKDRLNKVRDMTVTI